MGFEVNNDTVHIFVQHTHAYCIYVCLCRQRKIYCIHLQWALRQTVHSLCNTVCQRSFTEIKRSTNCTEKHSRAVQTCCGWKTVGGKPCGSECNRGNLQNHKKWTSLPVPENLDKERLEKLAYMLRDDTARCALHHCLRKIT